MRIIKLVVILVGLSMAAAVFADQIPLEGAGSAAAAPAQPQQVPAAPQPVAQIAAPVQQQQPAQQLPPVTQIPQANLVAAQSVTAASGTSLSVVQRVARLEQQQQNYSQMNLPQKIINMQQQLQQLQGQVDVQNHQLQLLTKQLQEYYKDLNQRLQQLPGAKATGASKPNIFSVPQATAVSGNTAATQGKVAYNTALQLLMNKQYPQAAAKMTAYLAKYPTGQYAVNANYWLGEIYYSQTQFAKAESFFGTVIKNYPNSNKVADSKYKLAMIHSIQGKQQQAQQEFQQVVKQYPSSSAATLAQQQLQVGS